HTLKIPPPSVAIPVKSTQSNSFSIRSELASMESTYDWIRSILFSCPNVTNPIKDKIITNVFFIWCRTSRIKTVRAGEPDCPHDNALSQCARCFDLRQI